jgi:hypothetical protein
MLAYFSDMALNVHKATVLGIAEEVSESLIDKKIRGKLNSDSPLKPHRKKKMKFYTESYLMEN